MSAEPAAANDMAPDESQKGECPFCVMMRKGGCEVPFKAFMDCGERADKANKDMADCLPMYEALHACMDKNKAVFDALLAEMKAEEAAREGAQGGDSERVGEGDGEGEGRGSGSGSGGGDEAGGSGGGGAAAAAASAAPASDSVAVAADRSSSGGSASEGRK